MQQIVKGIKFLFISEALSAPFDEGIKNVALALHKHLEAKIKTVSLTKENNCTEDLKIEKIGLNKLFLNARLKKLINNYSPDIILYLPEASVTLNSFIRAKILKQMCRHARVVLLGVKHIAYSYIQKKVIAGFLAPDYLMLLGRFEMNYYSDAGMKVKVLPPAVNNNKFYQAAQEEKEEIRSEYGIPHNKTVVLHVGHIRSTRNVQCFSTIQAIKEIQVVVVGSTSTPVENNLKDRLLKDGVCVIDKYIPDISRVYKMSDAYIFPVYDKIACIDMPLSVLEAMACNLPVITTRFGGLAEYFKEDYGVRYFNTIEELVDLVKLTKDIDRTKISNSKKVEAYTWGRFTDEIIAACNEVV